MTTAAGARRSAHPPLEVVPDPDDMRWLTAGSPASADDDVDEPNAWHAPTVLQQWKPEHQLIGALMWLTAAQAKPILELVPDTAIWRPTVRWAYRIIRGLVDEGRDPNPVIVLATAKHQPCLELPPFFRRFPNQV